MKLAVGTRIKGKKKCCKDKPRCKKCPVVLKRLEKEGLVERLSQREVVVVDVISKAQLKAARARA
ncbi:hypothetical protein [Conexibacter sp. SYSU D00693]|uniref:hypothetical protein n=1 Tax=Conexibacter sp. SYSU D00693 TaxID=2812560 RepID=UPI00196B60A8|nr:hypothetical protein [Conexibacter sp. SYSU D00693]